MATLFEKALKFRSLHIPGRPLILSNVWDAASARVVEDVGGLALATTSAGVAWTLGCGDGDHLSREQALSAIARITAVVAIPVTGDIERGYASDPAGVAETVRGVLAAGAVGINIEDTLRPVAEQVERIAAARRAADETGVPLFINARIDTHRLPSRDRTAWLDETCARARAYAEAGADGIFVLGTLDAQTVRTLVDAAPLPLNVLAGPGALPTSELASAGVARISAGSSIAEAAYGLVRRASRELLEQGTTATLEGGFDYAALNALLLAEPGR